MVRNRIEKDRPLCFEVYRCQYKRGLHNHNDLYITDGIVNSYWLMQHKFDFIRNMPEFLDTIRKNNITKLSELRKYTDYSDKKIEAFYYQMHEMKFLNTFDYTKDILDINWENVGLWEKYDHSPNWFIYYKSDCTKQKFSKMGLNYDEMDDGNE